MPWLENILQFLLSGKPVWRSGLKTWFQEKKTSDFLNVICSTRKIKLKMIWLSRDTQVLDSFSPRKWEVNTCSMWWGSLTFSLVSTTSTNDVPTKRGKRIMDRTQTHNIIARVNFRTRTYFFPKQTGNYSSVFWEGNYTWQRYIQSPAEHLRRSFCKNTSQKLDLSCVRRLWIGLCLTSKYCRHEVLTWNLHIESLKLKSSTMLKNTQLFLNWLLKW